MTTLRQLVKMAVPVSRHRHDSHNAALVAKLDALEARVADLTAHVARLEASVVYQRTVMPGLGVHNALPSLTPNDADYSLQACFAKLEKRAPIAFAHWHRLLEVNGQAYEGFPIDSCSVAGHPMAERFRAFLRPYLIGNVLDIGCGPQPVPHYLANYPVDRIAGLDPLAAPHPFVFVQGASEYLPWADGTFDTVVAATSLDHVLLPDEVMKEIVRVLRPGGHFVTWVSFVPGAKAYDPYASDVAPIDAFHLFHFERQAFESLMNRYFVAGESYAIDGESSYWSFQVRA